MNLILVYRNEWLSKMLPILWDSGKNVCQCTIQLLGLLDCQWCAILKIFPIFFFVRLYISVFFFSGRFAAESIFQRVNLINSWMQRMNVSIFYGYVNIQTQFDQYKIPSQKNSTFVRSIYIALILIYCIRNYSRFTVKNVNRMPNAYY